MHSPAFTIVRFDTYGIYIPPKRILKPLYPIEGAITSNYELVFYPEDWEGGVTIAGTFYPARKGCFTVCKPGQHRKSTRLFKCYYIYLVTEDVQLKEALDRLPPHGEHPQMEQILDILRTLKPIVDRNTLNARIEICTRIYQVLGLLLSQEYAVTKTAEGNPHRHQRSLLEADRYLREHIEEDVDLEKLAQNSNLSPTYFHKLFTAAFGETPTKRLQHYRHLAAKNYLRDDDCPIVEIARKCGYASQSYFCYKFKKREGISPSRYRQNRRYHRKHPLKPK